MKLNQEKLKALMEWNGSKPVPLSWDSACFGSFVYDREYGVVRCPFGAHQFIMATLESWHRGSDNTASIPLAEFDTLADKFLERPGTAFRSSCTPKILVMRPDNLEEWELRYFSTVQYIER